MPLSRQERRKAERDAAKRPAQASRPAQPAAAGEAATHAAAALANLNVNPGGDWTTQAEDEDSANLIQALGVEKVKQLAEQGVREAQYSMGLYLIDEYGRDALGRGDVDEAGTPLDTGTAGRTPESDVGLALQNFAK